MDILDQIVVHSETSTYPVPKLNHTCGMNNDWKDLLIDFSYVPKHWNFLNMHECSMDQAAYVTVHPCNSMPIWNARLAIDNFGTGLHATHCDKPHPNCIHDKKNQTVTVLLSNYCYKQHSSSSITWMELPQYDRGTYVHSR